MAVWAGSNAVWAIGVWASGVWQEALNPPVFSGTVPTREFELNKVVSFPLEPYFSPSPTSYSSIGTALPTGLSLNTTTGVISGTPTVVGATASVQFRGTNADGNDDTNAFTIIVFPGTNRQSLKVPLSHANETEHRRLIAQRANMGLAVDGSETMQSPVPLKTYAVADLPTASEWTGSVVYVWDEVGGATLAFSDGTNWRRMSDRAVVS